MVEHKLQVRWITWSVFAMAFFKLIQSFVSVLLLQNCDVNFQDLILKILSPGSFSFFRFLFLYTALSLYENYVTAAGLDSY